jgi:GNAT superfamily N-acetyltransferase
LSRQAQHGSWHAGGGPQDAIRVVRLKTRESCTIRPPRVDDYGKIADLAGQLGYPSTKEQIGRRMEGINDDDHAVFVAEVSRGRIAGWVGMYIFRSVEMDHCTFISGLVVDEAFRSQGVGKILLNAAEDWARIRGCNAICVSSNLTRSRAHGFYLGNGYRSVKTQITFLKSLEGARPFSRPC